MNIQTFITVSLSLLAFMVWQICRLLGASKTYSVRKNPKEKIADLTKEAKDEVDKHNLDSLVDMSNKHYGDSEPSDGDQKK